MKFIAKRWSNMPNYHNPNSSHRCNCSKCCPNNFNITQKKENTLSSLYEVENFLCHFSKALKCLNLYCLFK